MTERKIDLSQFREKFVREARERIARINGAMVYLEKNPGDAKLEGDILREAHTLKGASKMMGFAKISALAHQFEEALTRRKDRKVTSNQDLTDALFLTLDAISRLVASLSDSNRESIDVDEIIERLRVAQVPVDGSPGLPPAQPSPQPQASRQPPVVEAPPRQEPTQPGPRIGIPPAAPVDSGSGGIRVEPEKLEQLSTLVTNVVGHHLRQVELQEKIGELGRRYRRMSANFQSAVRDAASQGLLPESLLARIGPMLGGGRDSFQEMDGQLVDFHRKESELSGAMAHTLEDIRTELLSVRMVPLAPIFESFHRSVRDLARELGKDVDFVIRGGKTEIDRKVADALSEPLVHLIRNAIDHGIEPPEQRGGKKPAKGRITVSATPKKGRVVIEVEDDGRGIDLQEIRETAVKKGMITEKAAYRLDDREILAFIFRTGFSTAKTMTEISGRGIGMDVVRTVAEKFNGTVEVFSTLGQGTRVVLELPLSMAVSRILLFEVADQFFGLPIVYSEGVIRISDDQIATVEGKRTFRYGNEAVPVVWLSSLLGLERPKASPIHLAIMVRHSQRRMALVIDRVEGECEVVVRDLGKFLGKIQLFIGSTILGTGDVALLLDVYDIMTAVRMRPEGAPPEAGAGAGMRKRRKVLVVDDSLLSREMQARVLTAAGFTVETAAGAQAAIERLAREPFDLVLSEAQMEGGDGIEMVSRIRKDGPRKDVPVILVVSRERAADRLRAMASGAQDCVEKESFGAESVVPLIERLLAGRGK